MKVGNLDHLTGLKVNIMRYLRRVSTLGGLFPVNKKYYELLDKLEQDTLMDELLAEAYEEVTAYTLCQYMNILPEANKHNRVTFKQVVVELELSKPGEADKLLRRLEETIFLKKKALFSIIKAEDSRMVTAILVAAFIEVFLIGLQLITKSLIVAGIATIIISIPVLHAYFVKEEKPSKKPVNGINPTF
jgi:hypothetical protein